MSRFVALGGDSRTEYMSRYMTNYGLYTDMKKDLNCITEYDAVILPLPYTLDFVNIKETDIKISDFLNSINSKVTLFLGKADINFISLLNNKKIKFFDYNARDEFAQKNAVPTAQGVLSFVLNNINVTVSSLNIAVIGYGKCGKAICRVFSSLGAKVSSFSRRYTTAADAESNGLNAFLIRDLSEKISTFDLIINTVPTKIITKDLIDKTKENAIMIDIASYPYGFNIEYAESIGKKVNILSSLPGKCVPETAGIIIAETIINITEEGGLWKKSD